MSKCSILKCFLACSVIAILVSCKDDEAIVETVTFSIEVLAYDDASNDFELTNANVTLELDNESLVNQQVEAVTTEVTVIEKEGQYLIEVTKSNYLPFQKYLTASELNQFEVTPLKVMLLKQSITEGLIAFYPFNGDALDSTTHHFDGVVHGAVLTTDRKGNNNASFGFDGTDDYINVPHTTDLNLTGDFTISLWVMISSTQVPNEGINDILRKWNGNTEGYPFSISYLNTLADDAFEDKLIYVRYDGQGCAHAPTSYSPPIANDTFLHIVLIKQGNKLRHYLNNALIQEFTDNTSCSVANTADLTIGCRGNLLRFFKGKIDDIRIYGRAISASEVASLYIE